MAAGSPILSIKGLTKRFGGVAAVADATFDVAPGSITALIGPNGAGKSTLFNVVTGFLRPDAGEVLLDGRPVAHRSPHAIARRGMVRTFQLTKALTVMSVLDNVLLADRGHAGERLGIAALRPLWRGHEQQARQRALLLLETLGLGHKAADYAGTLSGGQRKLLELARALMLEPKIVLLDEPLAGVNRTLGLQLLEYIERVRAEHGLTILLIEHDLDVVMRHSDHVVVMSQGQVVAAGTPAEVRRDQRVIDAYLGSHADSNGDTRD